MRLTLKNLSQDTVNPLSHHVMASSNRFSSTQARAPDDKNVKKTVNLILVDIGANGHPNKMRKS